MELHEIEDLLTRINGATFASLDTETFPKPGIKKVTTGERVILFTNKGGSSYEKMVKRRLSQAGRNPNDFVLSDLQWGERIPNTPLIYHNGRYYLQTIRLEAGISVYYFADGSTVPEPEKLIKERRTNQGLAKGNEVLVSTYALKNINKITLLGETRPILRPKHGG